MPHRSDIPENIKRVTKTPKKIQPTCTNSSSSRVPLPSSSKAAKSSRARFPSDQNRFLRILLFRISPGSKLCMFLSGSRSSFRIVSKTLIKVRLSFEARQKLSLSFRIVSKTWIVSSITNHSRRRSSKKILPSSFLSLRLLRPWELLLSLLSPNHNCHHKGAL